MKISATIITFNEEQNIANALSSLDWADEIIVVDSESSDRTREIAKEMGAIVYVQKWLGFGRQKQLAVDKCKFDWIFSLDADEIVSDELKTEIKRIKNLPKNEVADGYKFSRLTYYMNRPIKFSGWYPDWKLRLFYRKKGAWKDLPIHESVEMQKDSKIKNIKKDILHYTVTDAAHHHKMIGERYAPLSAELMLQNGRKTSPFKIATVGFTSFLKSYILQKGILDGFPGFCISMFAAHHAFLKHLILWEKQNKQTK